MLPSFLRTALGPSCGRCQAYLASAPAATGTAMAEVPTRIPSSRPVGSPGLCTPASWPGCLAILPVSQKGLTRLSLRAGSGIRWQSPRAGSRGSCRGQIPCPPCPPPPPCHPSCLSALRGCSRHHPSKPSPEHPACLPRLPVRSRDTSRSLAATPGLPGCLGPAPAPPPWPWETLKHAGPVQEVQLLQGTRCPVPA